jgi:RNA polymerase sigma-70 factor (ECF subfamily)
MTTATSTCSTPSASADALHSAPTRALGRDFMDRVSPVLPRLHALARRLTQGRAAEAEDLVQETLVRAWTHWSRFEANGNVGAWMARILTNTFISRHRHLKVVADATAKYDLEAYVMGARRVLVARDPGSHLHEDELADEVIAALATLPAHYRIVLELVDLEGIPYRDAAKRLDLPVGTIMSRLHRARRLMRDALRVYGREHGLGLRDRDESTHASAAAA